MTVYTETCFTDCGSVIICYGICSDIKNINFSAMYSAANLKIFALMGSVVPTHSMSLFY